MVHRCRSTPLIAFTWFRPVRGPTAGMRASVRKSSEPTGGQIQRKMGPAINERKRMDGNLYRHSPARSREEVLLHEGIHSTNHLQQCIAGMQRLRLTCYFLHHSIYVRMRTPNHASLVAFLLSLHISAASHRSTCPTRSPPHTPPPSKMTG